MNTYFDRARELTEPQRRFLALLAGTRLPLMAAPMFLVSGVDLVVACAAAGVIGAYPAPNARSVEILDDWLRRTVDGIEAVRPGAPWALNMIVHSTYDRFDREMELVARYEPPIVSTALGSPRRVLEAVHGYGGIVMADVASPTMARKAVEAGVDALVVVVNGAGGHTGAYNPFSLMAEIRRFWDGPLGLAGGISHGRDIRAAKVLGADFAVAGTAFIAASESLASDEYREALIKATLEDLVLSKAVSGVAANWLRETMVRAGIDPDVASKEDKRIDFSGDISSGKRAWKDVWSAGHGVGQIDQVRSAGEIVAALHSQYRSVLQDEQHEIPGLLASL